MIKKLTKEQEQDIVSRWYGSDLYSFDRSNHDAKKFYIDTPPPTVSGFLHMGHVFSYVQTDIIARYKRMSGFNVFYPIGFDDNGLPTERLVEKIFDIKVSYRYKKETVEKITASIINFIDSNNNIDTKFKDQLNNLLKNIKENEVCAAKDFIIICKLVIDDAEKDFETLFKTIALSVDWKLKYQTISDKTTEISQNSFIDLYNKGLIYQKLAPVYWDVVDKTALAQADIEDKEVDSFENIILFQVQNSTQTLKIMTTRPEMLEACVCVFFNPNDERYANYKNSMLKVPLLDKFVPLLPDEDVKQDKGTGLVMCCTYGDWQDVLWVKKYNLTPILIISDDGKVNGIKIEEKRKQIIEELKNQNLLIEQKSIKHPVKCGERSGKPIEILEKNQWYVSVLPFKEKLLKITEEKLNFYPDFMKLRLIQWISGLNQDWCISRDRFSGIRIPAWKLIQIYNNQEKDTDIIFVGTDSFVSENKSDIISNLKDKYDDTLYDLKQVDGVLDTWFTSSITPAIAFGSLDKCPVFNIRPQAHEIIRTWAFYTVVKSYLHSLKKKDNNLIESDINTPWYDLMLSGWCLASDKTKMSKSKGNVVTPLDLIEKNGVDVVRFWCSNSSLGMDTAYSEQFLDKGNKFVIKLTNVANFIMQKIDTIKNFSEIQDFLQNHNLKSLSQSIVDTADKWIVSKCINLYKDYSKNLDSYEYFKARCILDDFFWNDLCDNYLEIVKIRYYGIDALIYKDKNLSSVDKDNILLAQKSALISLFIVLVCILHLYAPYLPYITDYIYSNLKIDTKNIHSINSFKKWFFNEESFKYSSGVNDSLKSYQLINIMLQVISDVRKYKSDNKLPLNAKLQSFTISSDIDSKIINDIKLDNSLYSDLKNVTCVEEFN